LHIYAPPRGSTIPQQKRRENRRPPSRNATLAQSVGRTLPSSLRLDPPSRRVFKDVQTPNADGGTPRQPGQPNVDDQEAQPPPRETPQNAPPPPLLPLATSPPTSPTSSKRQMARRHRTTTQSTPSQRSKVKAKDGLRCPI
jgi:hypothetical protein